MSSLSLPQRFQNYNLSTTSVDSWEVAAQKLPPRAQSWNNAKPLPPTPTRPGIPSSKFNVYVEDLLPQTSNIVSLEDIPQPNKVYQQTKVFSTSTPDLPDKLPPRPQLRRDVKTQIEADSAREKKKVDSAMFKEWKAPKYESSDDEADPDSPTLDKILSPTTQESSDPTHVAEQHAAEYMSVLHACDALLPSFDKAPHSKSYGDTPHNMSASVTDFVDEYLVPHALRLSTTEESQPSSYFSSDSEASEYECGKKAFRLRAKKAFHSRKPTKKKAGKTGNGSSASRAMSLSPSERAVIQDSIIAMYGNLNSLYRSSAKSELKVELTALENEAVAEGIPTPATSTTSEQQLESVEKQPSPETATPCPSESAGTTWLTQSRRQRASKDSKSILSYAESKPMKLFRFPVTDKKSRKENSVAKKLAKAREAVTLKTSKGKKKANEKKREGIKKTIVFVGPTDSI